MLGYKDGSEKSNINVFVWHKILKYIYHSKNVHLVSKTPITAMYWGMLHIIIKQLFIFYGLYKVS
jgi:hypothetical protein